MNEIFNTFLSDIENWCNKNQQNIDLIFITGDLVYSGKEDQFKTALFSINKIIEKSEVKLENVFIVPGNHDIDRDKINGVKGFSCIVGGRSEPYEAGSQM